MAESLTYTGTIIQIGSEDQVSEKFRKREFVVSDEGSQYPQEVMFQLSQDRCDIIDPYAVGEEIKVSFNLRGRRWENPETQVIKFFNTLDAWKIERVGQDSNSQPQLSQKVGIVSPTDSGNMITQQGAFDDDDSDSLPF